MNGQRIIQSFQNYLEGKGLDKKSLSLQILPEIFVSYYKDVKFVDVDKENDGDMLLFQYVTYNWGEGKYFQINFTRQFYEVFKDDSHQIYQLGVTLFYSPKDFDNITSFNKWSSDCSDLNEFQNIIIKSIGFEKALDKMPVKKEIAIDLI